MPSSEYDADVIVIGSGVLGSLAAYRLAKQGKSVIILEAGPRVRRWQIVENYRNTWDKSNPQAPYPNLAHAPTPYQQGYLQQKGPIPFDAQYLRVVGGTTWHWSSATWRLLPNDFKLKTLYGRGRDWPLDYTELEPYYAQAEVELGVNGPEGENHSGQVGGEFPPRSTPFPMPALPFSYMDRYVAEKLSVGGYIALHEPNGRASKPYDGRPPCCGNNNCVPICPIGSQYSGDMHAAKAERAGAKLIDQAVVFNIEAGPDHKITAVDYIAADGAKYRLTARVFILAAHAIEGPKLLLMSISSSFPDGIANSSGMVGRNLMDHTGMSTIMLAKDPVWPGRGAMELMVFLQGRDGDFRRDRSAYKQKLRNEIPNRQVVQALLDKGVLGSKLDEQIKYQSARWLSFATDFEMLPNPANRIVPSKEKWDGAGLPVPELYYDVDDYWRSGRDAAQKDIDRFTELLDAKVIKSPSGYENRRHIMGTTIMGDNAGDSVVDRECRTHDHPNLFIAGTSVMPSSACVNPTLTGAALALRLAATIGKEI